MSQTSASLLLAVFLIGFAVYLTFSPPPGFEETIAYRLTLPFILIVTAFGVLENLRTRAHMGQLVGALRSLMGRKGVAPTPQITGEAIKILLKSMKAGPAHVTEKAAVQLEKLTGQSFGTDVARWESWWEANSDRFKGPPAAPSE